MQENDEFWPIVGVEAVIWLKILKLKKSSYKAKFLQQYKEKCKKQNNDDNNN